MEHGWQVVEDGQCSCDLRIQREGTHVVEQQGKPLPALTVGLRLTVPLLSSLLANVPEKAVQSGPSIYPLPLLWKTQMEFLTSD